MSIFPVGVATPSQLYVAKDGVFSFIAGAGIDNATTSVPVTAGTGSRFTVGQAITTDDTTPETMQVTAIVVDTLTVTRNIEGNVGGPFAHAFGTRLIDLPVAGHHNLTANEVIAIEQWLLLGVGEHISTKTGNYTLLSTDFTILANAAGGNMVLTLPTAIGASGKQYDIKKIDATANTVTINTTAAQNIDGAASQVLSAQWQSLTVISNDIQWYIL